MARRRAQAATRDGGSDRRRAWLSAVGRGVAGALLLAGLAWALDRLIDPATLPVRSVQVRGGYAHVGRQPVIAAIAPFLKAGFLRLDMEGIRHSLEGLAWVRRATLRRTWPDTLEVRIEEQRPLANWAAGGLVNQEGELFRPTGDAALKGLPVFDGPEDTSRELATHYRTIRGMLNALGVRVTRLAMTERGAWQIWLDNGLELKLGRRNTERRLMRFMRSYAEAIAPQLDRIDSVDLRYTNGFAVRWKSGMAPQA